MDKHNAQEVQEPARAPEVLKLTAAAMRRDVRALDIFASVLDQPENVQLDAFIEKLAEYAQEAQEPTGEQLAFSLPDYNPELDPAGAAFDPAAYRQAIDDAGGWQTFKAELLDREELRDFYGRFMDAHRAAAEAFRNSPAAKAAAKASEGLVKAMKKSQRVQEVARASQVIHKALLDALETPEMQARLQEVQEIAEETEKLRNKYEPYFLEAWPKFAEAPNFIKDVAYSLILELDIAQEAGQFEGVTVPEVLDAGYNSEWEKIEGSPFFDLLTVAERGAALFPTLDRLQALQNALEAAQKGEADLPQIIANDLVNIPYPVDKSNSLVLWNADAWQTATKRSQVPGQLSFPVLFEEKQHAAATFIYSFPAEDVNLPKNFDQYDRRVYFAVSAIYHQLGPYMTIRQIFKTMTGSDTNPSKADRNKIYKSLLKMRAASVDVDCSAEIKAFQKEYKKRGVKIENPVYNDILLDWSSFSGKVNGKDAVIIHIKSEPLLFNFARVRGEITTIDRKLLETPSGMNLTKQVIALQDYLIYQISLKNGPTKRKLAYTTIEERCNIKGKDAKRRARGTVKDLLQDFKIKGFIVSWREYKKDGKPEGVEITRKAAQYIEQ